MTDRRGNILSLIRSRLLAGVVTILPAIITLWVIVMVVRVVDGISQPFFEWCFSTRLPGFGILFALISLYIIGGIAQNRLFGRLISWSENLLNRVPILGSMYSAVRQTINAFRLGSHSDFQRVVFVEYPRKGLWSVAFVTKEFDFGEEKRFCAFVPTTPNPTSGVLITVAETDMRDAEMSPEEAAKFIISAGLVQPGKDGVGC